VKKHTLLFSNLIIIISIIIGYIGIVYKDTIAYQDLSENNLQNVLSLADTDISNHIDNSMTKPLMVSKTMANDEFLKDWLIEEPKNTKDDAYLDQLYSYLKAYQQKYGYTTVFCVSQQTGNYYYQDGLNKTVSSGDQHDIWYYNFTKSGQEYDIEVDTNQVQSNTVTIFINFRVVSDDGRLLGVIGVGLQLDLVEDTIRNYEHDYGLSVYIIDAGSSKNSFTGSTDIFLNKNELAKRTGITDEIVLDQPNTSNMQWFTAGNQRKCLITNYNDTLGWYLVLEKDTGSINSAFQDRITNNISFMLISLAACIAVTSVVFINYNGRILVIENTDELTGLPNRKLFAKKYPAFLRKNRDVKKTMFMFDIDHFKNMNDTYGHIFGNTVLAMVGEELRSAMEGYGIAARWGGDEFLGVLAAGPEETERILSRFMEALRSEEKDDCCRVTISIGISEVDGKLSMEQMVNRVDEALYCSKEGGRNRITVL
jgi:diguanylate cyclase (GGDEF) domain